MLTFEANPYLGAANIVSKLQVRDTLYSTGLEPTKIGRKMLG